MAADGSRGVLGLWLLAAAGLCGGVAAGKSPSCHEVRTAFQLRQIGPLKLVPDVPTAESDLQICQHRAPTCCTKKMEESYQAAVRRERTQSIQALNFELKYMIVGHITAFQEAFESLLRFAENRTSSLFETAYRPMAKEAAEPVKELFTDISLYILGAETTVESAVLRFFDSLFPLVYSRLINPGITDLSEDYTECLRLTRQDINPFGHYSKNMVTELSKSLWASRMLSQALNLGIEVINTTEHAALTKECSKALVKMQYCPHCQGLTLIRPCVGYCLNVMRGCLASVSELDAQWREYISTLEYLTNEMAASHDVEIALMGIWSSINEAILHAQLNGPQLSATGKKSPKQLASYTNRVTVGKTVASPLSLFKVVYCKRKVHCYTPKPCYRKKQHPKSRDCDMANKENELACAGNLLAKVHNSRTCFLNSSDSGSSQTEGPSSKYSGFFSEVSQDHETMTQVLFSRNLRLNVALTFWRRRSINELVTYLVRIQDLGVVVDCLPVLTKSLQEEKPFISVGCCVDLLPLVKSLLKSKYEEYVIVGLNWLQAVIKRWWSELSAHTEKAEDGNIHILKQELSGLWEQQNHLTLVPGYTGNVAKDINAYLLQLH